ncbi:hypothetical protein EON65_25220 [archaeon]|nr:MAG: hypothetical protein EON65_25220 [archaeon]
MDVNKDGHISHSEFFMAMTGMQLEEAQGDAGGYGDFDREDGGGSGRNGSKGGSRGRGNQMVDSPSRRHSTGGQGSKKFRASPVTSSSKTKGRSSSSGNNNNNNGNKNSSYSDLAIISNDDDGDGGNVGVGAASPKLSHRHSISAIRMTSTKSNQHINTVVEASEASSSKDSKSGSYVSMGGKSFNARLPTNLDFQEVIVCVGLFGYGYGTDLLITFRCGVSIWAKAIIICICRRLHT